MRVLVTGASGFLGNCIARRLRERGDTVRVFVRRAISTFEQFGIEAVYGDICDKEALHVAVSGVDCVVHCAARVGLSGCYKEFFRVNVLGTKELLLACEHCGVNRFVYTSSPSVVFHGTDQRGISESTPYARRWLCAYARTKALAEQEVLGANGRNGLSTCALRPHLIWGPGDPHLIPGLLKTAQAGKLFRVGDGENIVDTTYIDNAANAHLNALDALGSNCAVGGRAYFISQGEPVYLWSWIDNILKIANAPPVRRHISKRVGWLFASCCDFASLATGRVFQPTLTRFLVAQLSCSHYFDISKAQYDLCYAPTVSMDQGMCRLANELRLLENRRS